MVGNKSEKYYTTDQVAELLGITRPGVVNRARQLHIFPVQSLRGERNVKRKMFFWTEEDVEVLRANKRVRRTSMANKGKWGKEMCTQLQPCLCCQIKDDGICMNGKEATCYKLTVMSTFRTDRRVL